MLEKAGRGEKGEETRGVKEGKRNGMKVKYS